MKCHIPGQNVKVLGRTVHALARFGDELYLESLEDCIILRTLNAAESAYAMVKFYKKFFSYFNYNYYSTDDNEGLKCKISMKSALNTFKSPTHMDKQVENLEIKLDPESCKLIFQLRCKHGIIKTHYVSILDCKAVNVAYTVDSVPNRITAHHRILLEALNNFQTSDDHVTLEASTKCLLLRNYIDDTSDHTKLIRTQVNLKPMEFNSYSIDEETVITFTFKEFKALLSLAEALNLPIKTHFETTGRPAVFIIQNGTTFEAHFVLSTSKADNHTQVTNTTTTESKKRKTPTPNNASLKKKHLNPEIECLDEDSHLFNFIDVPDDNIAVQTDKINGNIKVVNGDGMDCDNFIPASPTSKNVIRSVFKRCFDKTFDPRILQQVILADNSDSE